MVVDNLANVMVDIGCGSIVQLADIPVIHLGSPAIVTSVYKTYMMLVQNLGLRLKSIVI